MGSINDNSSFLLGTIDMRREACEVALEQGNEELARKFTYELVANYGLDDDEVGRRVRASINDRALEIAKAESGFPSGPAFTQDNEFVEVVRSGERMAFKQLQRAAVFAFENSDRLKVQDPEVCIQFRDMLVEMFDAVSEMSATQQEKSSLLKRLGNDLLYTIQNKGLIDSLIHDASQVWLKAQEAQRWPGTQSL